MSYLALARKWRPRTFADVVGQEHVVRALSNALASDRVHHAYLLAGTRGVGKTTIARILAKALNCRAGVSAEPCGDCDACLSVDDGRFVDLIEVDAASRTGVDDMRELLENVQYTPTSGRFKVYLIDEVHMLSRQSFNALLKTLEEPPPHVKFLFATTDPQKLPVTVLSRCLQFNLKRMSRTVISERMREICAADELAADPAALQLLAKAAAGSLRDGLSLLDQALAFGGERLTEADVVALLGSLDRQRIFDLLGAIGTGDGHSLLARLAELDELVPDYESVLDELAVTLQRVAVVQVVGADALDEEDDAEAMLKLAECVDGTTAQLLYQIAITSRRDLGLAPDPRTGFEMAMLRMLAFRPADGSTSDQPKAKPGPTSRRKTAPSTARPTRSSKSRAERSASAERPVASGDDPGNWPQFVAGLALDGAARELAANCELETQNPFELVLRIDRRNEHLLTDMLKERLVTAIHARADAGINVRFRITEAVSNTVASRAAADADRELSEAWENLQSDESVKELIDLFDAELISDSVRPVSGDNG